MTAARKSLIAVVIIVVLAVAGMVGSVAILDSEWLESKLEAKVAEALQADLEIGDIEFSPLQGAAALREIRLHREANDSSLDVSVARAEIDVQVLPLIVRSLVIERLELASPHIVATKRRKPSPKTAGTMGKLKGLLKKTRCEGVRRRETHRVQDSEPAAVPCATLHHP